MLWKGCLQLLLIFGLFGAGLYGLFRFFNQTNSSSQNIELIEKSTYTHFLDYESELLTAFHQVRSSNYPASSETTSKIDIKCQELGTDDILAFIIQSYLNGTSINDLQLKADELKGLNLKHFGVLSSRLSQMDVERVYATLNAHFLKDVRSVSAEGLEDQIDATIDMYNGGYFSDDQLAIALTDLSAELTWDVSSDLYLIVENGTFVERDLSPQLKQSIIANLLAGGIEFQSVLKSLLFPMMDETEEKFADAILSIFFTLDDKSPEWHFSLLDTLIKSADDDVITVFLNKTSYVENHLGGLYQDFHPEIFEVLPIESREFLISRLDDGVVTLFESQAIDDLTNVEVLDLAEKTLSHYSDLIEDDPTNPSNYFERGKILANEFDDHKSAIEDFSFVISLDQTFSDAYFYRSLSREKLNDITGSITDYDNVLLYEPDNINALGNRAIMKHEIGDYAEAISDYSETISIDTNYVDAYYGRALSKSFVGDTAGAIEDYGSAILLDNHYLNAYINRALINIELMNNEQALSDYSNVLAIEETNVDGLYGMAYTYYKIDSLNLSKQYYEKLVIKHPEESAAFYLLGTIHHEQLDFKRAYSYLTKSIFMDSTYGDAYLQRGLTSLNLGDTINACLDWVNAKDMGMMDASGYLTTYCKN